MSKPHEEEWVLLADDAESAPEIWRKDGGLLFSCNDASRARFASAAPDMARALLAFLPHHSVIMTKDEAERVTMAQAALRKAEVLP